MSTAHFACSLTTAQLLPFQGGFAAMQNLIAAERISIIYHCGSPGVPLVKALALAA